MCAPHASRYCTYGSTIVDQRLFHFTLGVLIVIGITVSWTGATQFSKSLLTDPESFYAPYFMVWFSTCWMILCYPAYLIFTLPVILREPHALQSIMRDAGNVFGDDGLAVLPALKRTIPFAALWILANYSYNQALGHISAAETTAIFSSNPAFVYALALVVLKDRLLPLPILSILLAAGGIVLMAYSQGFGTFHFIGLLMAVVSSFVAAVYKVAFKKVVGDATLGQVSLFMTSLGFCNLVFSSPIMLALALTATENIIWNHMPWAFLCGSAVLALIFNFLINFGIAFSHPLFISVGFFLGMPLNAAVDAVVRGESFGLYEIGGGCCILLILVLSIASNTADERAVFEYAFNNYNKHLRPIRDAHQALSVHLAAAVEYLLDVDELNEVYSVFVYTELSWNDQYIRWNPEQFDEIEQIQIPSKLLWIPPIFVPNMLAETEVFEEDEDIATVNYDGNITVLFVSIFKLKCQFNILAFPFDEQTCNTEYAVKGFSDDQIQLIHDPKWEADTMSWIRDNPEWQILSYTPQIVTSNWTEGNRTVVWNKIKYEMRFARKPTYYMLSIVAPSFTITALCLIGLFTPSSSTGERNEKVTLGLTTLLTMAVMLQIVTNQMPKSATGFPLLGSYILYEMMLAAFGTALTVLLMFLHERAVTRWGQSTKLGNASKTERYWKTNDKNVEQDGVAKFVQALDRCETKMEMVINILKEKQHQERMVEKWNKVFDRVDIVLLVVFQAVNILLTYYCLITLQRNQK